TTEHDSTLFRVVVFDDPKDSRAAPIGPVEEKGGVREVLLALGKVPIEVFQPFESEAKSWQQSVQPVETVLERCVQSLQKSQRRAFHDSTLSLDRISRGSLTHLSFGSPHRRVHLPLLL